MPAFSTEFARVIGFAAVITDALNTAVSLPNAVVSALTAADSVRMFVCAWLVTPETDADSESRADPRPVASALNAVLSDESTSVRDAVAELRALESTDTEVLRA